MGTQWGTNMRVVAKFGGTSLGSGDRIERAADSVANAVEAGHEIAVVASAMGSTTDDLLDDITFETDDSDRAEIVSMGERTSVRMLKAALSVRDIDAVFLEPGHPDWPVITNELGEVDAEETQKRVHARSPTDSTASCLSSPASSPRITTVTSPRSVAAAPTPLRSCSETTWTPTKSSSSPTSKA